MFNLSCGFFVKSKEQKSNQERNALSRPGQMQMQRNNAGINTDTNLPTPASGYVYFNRQTPQYKQNPMIVPVGTILATDYGNLYSVVPDIVTPGYNNPNYSQQYNAYICNAMEENLTALVVALPFNQNGAPSLGTMGNINEGEINAVYGGDGNNTIPNCDSFTNLGPFTNGTGNGYLPPANTFRK